ncbi:MAG: 3'-5' exonuclease, partial [Candidatus Latescibacterota bacterium]|nr:3'-5' exonuclease [Candidatus Latescibacterota bacterium]
VDAMQTHSSDVNLELSMSFRFGASVAETVSKLITEAKNEKGFSIQGTPQVKSSVSFYKDRDLLSLVRRFKGLAILSRTNLNLFTKAIQLRKDGIPFTFERDVTPQMLRTLDVYWLSLGNNEKIRDPFIKSFKTLEHLEHHASEMDDREFSQMAKVVRDYAKDLPNIIFDLIKIHKDNTQKANKDAVILSTIHSAKGQEYNHVIIGSDLPYFLSEDTDQEEETFLEEVNIAYVAFTRVKQQLFLPTDFKTLFNREWQDYVSKFKPLSKSPKGSPRTASYARRKKHPASTIDIPRTVSHPPPKMISNGTRVTVPNGEGIVVEIKPDKCLINLNNQEANIWEQIENIKPV